MYSLISSYSDDEIEAKSFFDPVTLSTMNFYDIKMKSLGGTNYILTRAEMVGNSGRRWSRCVRAKLLK